MTVTLTYTLPEDKTEANAAEHGMDILLLLQDLDNELRSLIKYSDTDKVPMHELERLRSLINDGCVEAGINLWD